VRWGAGRRKNGGFTSDKAQRVNSRGEFEPISLRRCNPDGKSLHLVGFPTSDPTNNFKLYDGVWLGRQGIESTGGFEVGLELCYKAFAQGERIAELPTAWYDRTDGESRFNMRAWIPRYLRWYLRSVWALFGRALRLPSIRAGA